MNKKIFRAYDIRGVVDTELMIADVFTIAQAIGAQCKAIEPRTTCVAVGMDGRIHSSAIQKALCAGLQEQGLNVIFVGVCPTPALYFATHTLAVQAGVMITASHNDSRYNGLKIVINKRPLTSAEIQAIWQRTSTQTFTPAAMRGNYQEYAIINDYSTYLLNEFAHLKGNTWRATIDCLNGAGATILPALVQAFDWPYVTVRNGTIDPLFTAGAPDPTQPARIQELRSCLQGQIGIALDGDCDRMVAISETGEPVPGDHLLALFAQDLLTRHPGASIILDAKCSSSIIQLIRSWGGTPHITPSGHGFIKAAMRTQHALLGGELSCHFCFADRGFGYDDGIYALLKLCELLNYHKVPLSKLLQIIPPTVSTPELRIACAMQDKEAIIGAVHTFFEQQKDMQVSTIDGIRVEGATGWGIVRASNTEDVISMRIEATTREELCHWRELYRQALAHYPAIHNKLMTDQ